MGVDYAAGTVLLFDKPLGWTSFDLVNSIRHSLKNYTGIKKLKVGHAGTLDPLASGLLIMVNKPFDVGDTVEIGSDIKGKVKAVTIFSTMVEKDDGLTMIVPNNTVWSGVITNYSTRTSSNTSANA